jgi:5'-methylthioadenosine nucleosidase
MTTKIAIVMAMQAEADPLIENLRFCHRPDLVPPGLPFRFYTTVYGQQDLLLVTSGKDPRFQVDNVATVPAALMAYQAIERCAPSLLINCGTAGGIKAAGAMIGDVYLSKDKICFHHRRIPIPGFWEYGVGSYPVIDSAAIAAALGLKRGIISTGDSLDLCGEDLSLIEQHGAIVKDMEAAAIAWVCYTCKVPMLAVKSITDLIDKAAPTADQFLDNLALASSNLQRQTVAILDFLQNNECDQL